MRVLRLAIPIILILLAFVFWSSKKPERSFPKLSERAYIGELVGLRPGESARLYIENIEADGSQLWILFDEAWQPQIFQPKLLSDELSTNPIYDVVQLSQGDLTFSFYGKAKGAQATGAFESSDGRHGSWRLSALSSEEMSRFIDAGQSSSLDLERWLDVKGEYRFLDTHLKDLQREQGDKRARAEQLKTVLLDRDVLLSRSGLKQKQFTKELEESRAEDKEVEQQRSQHLSELKLAGRISKEGKAIELSRRLVKRELKWYLANWGAKEDDSALAELEGQNLEFDVERLGAEYRHAVSIKQILDQVAAEKAQIAELERRLQEKNRLGEEPDSQPLQDDKLRKKSLWNRIFG